MDPSFRSEDVIDLGKALVRELDLSDSVDTLARWMAHALAEKIAASESGPPAGRPARQAEVIDLILKLWAHRRDFPRGARPFEELEGLATALVRLDPNDPTPRFFSPANPQEILGAMPEAKPWLDRALAIDASARAAIRYCLVAADEAVPGKAPQWAKLAEAAGQERDFEVVLVKFVDHLSEQQSHDLDDSVQRHLKSRLESLKEAAAAIEADVARKSKGRKRRRGGSAKAK